MLINFAFSNILRFNYIKSLMIWNLFILIYDSVCYHVKQMYSLLYFKYFYMSIYSIMQLILGHTFIT
jgi:hypothetical protein